MTETTTARIAPAQLADAVARSQSYAEYDAVIPSSGEALRRNFAEVTFTPAEVQAIEAIPGRFTLLAIVEDWCPDVIANLPMLARVEELNPNISLRVLDRPDHQALANAYPGPSGRSHIPTYVLFDSQGGERGVLVERPEAITREIRVYGEAAKAEIAERFPGVAREDLPADFVEVRTREAHEMRRKLRDAERADVVAWLLQAARA